MKGICTLNYPLLKERQDIPSLPTNAFADADERRINCVLMKIEFFRRIVLIIENNDLPKQSILIT